MRYANLIKNDVVNGQKVCASLFMQGCPHHCPNCFNPETWDFNGGQEINIQDLIEEIKTAISANGVQRNFSILGGEPLAPENISDTITIARAVKEAYPDIKIFLWTGYEYYQLIEDPKFNHLLCYLDYIIDGPFIEELKDLTLWLRGSKNQSIYYVDHVGRFDLVENICYNNINEKEKEEN